MSTLLAASPELTLITMLALYALCVVVASKVSKCDYTETAAMIAINALFSISAVVFTASVFFK